LIHWTDAKAPLSVAWTLFFEVQFYLLFAVAIASKRAAVLGLTAWLIVILTFGSAEYGDAKGLLLVDLFSWYNLNFLLGIAAAVGVARLRDRFARTSVIAGIAFVVVFLLSWREGLYDVYSQVRLIGGVGFALVVYGGVSLERSTGWSAPRMLVFLGDASYTIYLAHLPLASLYMMVASRFGVIERIGVTATFALGCLSVLALCSGLYFAVERPVISWSRRWISQHLSSSSQVGAGAAVQPPI